MTKIYARFYYIIKKLCLKTVYNATLKRQNSDFKMQHWIYYWFYTNFFLNNILSNYKKGTKSRVIK